MSRELGARMLRRRNRVLGRAEVVELRPGDFVVLETKERVSQADAQELRQQLAAFTGVSEARIIVVYNATLKVLREGDPPLPPVILSPGSHP